ncbi:tyrosine-type recombinase/integrase [Bacillus dakarensis]|uniref:tyrosine-type recombinase/integrase n=1 Tax=Robertmurraya dakarensis TaxID=1926278 RepID=UPI000980E745|nr:site-specific integrase [Bacillus dakarensis]
MDNVLPLIDMKKDTWILPSSDDLHDYSFVFEYLPNEWFKETIKKIAKENITIGRLKLSTLNRYNYSLMVFFDFLESYDIELATFKDISYELIEGFVHYLLANVDSPSTRSVIIASLKHHIKHGQMFEWEGFPAFEVFDGTEQRTLQTEDTLKSMLIDDVVMDSIDSSLRQWKSTINPVLENLNDVVLWVLITVIRHTGIRLTEALNLNSDCLNRDLMKKYLLEVVSPKNETERFIPVSKEVAVAIDYLSQTTKDLRVDLNSNKLFYYNLIFKNSYKILDQNTARDWLRNKFIKKFDIKDSNGKLAVLTFHNFRHQIGTDLLNNGMSAFEVMQYLGHESMHSTRLYAKVRNDRLTKEYKKVGFIGVIKQSIENIVDEEGKQLDSEKRLMAQLPDGVCAKPINTKVIDCKKPNACLFCPKFITTPEFLDIHKVHLERIRADKERYLAEDLMGSEYHLFETEKALEDIISRLQPSKKGDH